MVKDRGVQLGYTVYAKHATARISTGNNIEETLLQAKPFTITDLPLENVINWGLSVSRQATKAKFNKLVYIQVIKAKSLKYHSQGQNECQIVQRVIA